MTGFNENRVTKLNYCINVKSLHVDTIIGVYDQEKTTIQVLIVDLTLHTCVDNTAKTDDIGNVIDYAELVANIQQFMVQNHFQLLETLAYTLIRHLFQCYSQAERIFIEIKKPAALKHLCDHALASVCFTCNRDGSN